MYTPMNGAGLDILGTTAFALGRDALVILVVTFPTCDCTHPFLAFKGRDSLTRPLAFGRRCGPSIGYKFVFVGTALYSRRCFFYHIAVPFCSSGFVNILSELNM